MDRLDGGIRVGDAVVRRIHEADFTFRAADLLPAFEPDAAAADLDMLVPEHMTADRGSLTISVHAWLVRHAGRVVLVDAGIGNGKRRSAPLFDRLETPFLQRLAQAGVQPEDVTDVLLTHLHVDHVGWCTRGSEADWRPTFPNARHVVPRVGYDFFETADGRADRNRGMFEDSVLPVVKTGLAEFVGSEGGAVGYGFHYHPTPGHSRDHCSIAFDSGTERALFTADVFHHPVQLRRPDWSSVFCADRGEATRARLWALAKAADEDRLVFGSHVAGSSAGRVGRSENAFVWLPEPTKRLPTGG